MQSANQLSLPGEVISRGVDWLTGTAKTGASKYEMGVLAADLMHKAMDAGERPKVQKRQGYEGYAIDGFFHGEKHGSGMVVTSGEKANDLWRCLSSVCDNVSRLDVQVTVWTYLERPHVAKVIHEQIKRKEFGTIPIRNATYIEGTPNGETVNINKRCSDNSARCYDKASEGGLGLPRSIWRYEVEHHRRSALAVVTALRTHNHPLAASEALVHSWFMRRGIRPLFEPGQDSNAFEISLGRPKHDTMTWFRDRVSKTVAVQVGIHGRDEVLKALGLSDSTNSGSEEVG